ncbi:hypothetical protein BDN70DRAFT_886907 [Pholiota conissans]|uniref:ATP synthase F0 subunit 8 n=1 Tax=Pholiota conissans TaxID=109636 RepID=A0A9P5YP79_9AGAR|nr:hypothetical protein BDN70DRAFT_886907 [Pholiota conissans]
MFLFAVVVVFVVVVAVVSIRTSQDHTAIMRTNPEKRDSAEIEERDRAVEHEGTVDVEIEVDIEREVGLRWRWTRHLLEDTRTGDESFDVKSESAFVYMRKSSTS